MPAYLITWKPTRRQWDPEDLQQTIAAVNTGINSPESWSCGNNKRIRLYDNLFLLKQGREPPGMAGSGIAASVPFEEPHWSGDDRTALYIEFYFDALINGYQEVLIHRNLLVTDPRLSSVHWNTQNSGITIPDHIATLLLNLIHDRLYHDHPLAEEIPPATSPPSSTMKVPRNA